MRPLRSFLLLLIFLACFTGLHYIIHANQLFPSINEFIPADLLSTLISVSKDNDVMLKKPADTLQITSGNYLNYPIALANGWPIATGVIEGACRHIVADRFDVTGARWGLAGAEAILKLRALRSNGDFETYWTWHLNRERHRVHESRYLDGAIPRAA